MVATVQQQTYLQMQIEVIAAQRILNGAELEPLVIVLP